MDNLDYIAAAAGAILSIAFATFPKLKTTYQAMVGGQKRLVMLVACLVVACGLALYDAGAPDLVSRWLTAIGLSLSANQLSYFSGKLLLALISLVRKPILPVDDWYE